MKRRDEQLDLPLALVPGAREHVGMILRCEVRREQLDGRQRQLAGGESLEDDRKAPGRPRDFNAVVRGGLGEMKRVGAIRDARSTPRSLVDRGCMICGRLRRSESRKDRV